MQTNKEREDTQAILETYQPVHPLPYYCGTHITLSGSVRPAESLPSDLVNFLEDVGEDVTLWNGARGVLGRSYVQNQPVTSVSKPSITPQHFTSLRTKYMAVKRKLSFQKDRSLLRLEEERQSKMQSKIGDTVAESEKKVQSVRRRMQQCDSANPRMREQRKSLSSVLYQVNVEAAKAKQAADILASKIAQTKANIAEQETGFLLRYAILQVLWNEPSRRASCLRSVSQSGESSFSSAAAAKKAAGVATFSFLQARRLYIDCKLGLASLYKVESTLKSMLENLQQGMEAHTGKASSRSGNSTATLPTEKGAKYRIAYVRRLWSGIDPHFQAAFPYLKKTSLRTRSSQGSILDEHRDTISSIFELSRRDTVASIFEEPRNYGTFSNAASLLPKYTDVDKGILTRTEKKIAALHTAAASAYKFINDIYDSQLRWVEATLEEYMKREQDWFAANEKLLTQWENLIFR